MKNQTCTSNRVMILLMIGIILFILLTTVFSSFSQETGNEDKTLSPYFLVLSDDPATDQLPLKSTSAEVNIAGVIADVTINQVYKNEGKNALEAIYTFPASSQAAVYAMEMTIGDRTIVAKVEEKNKARREYNQAKAEGKRTSLLEQQRPNVFQMNVANIMPGDEIKVSLKYTEILVPENSIYSFVYPTVVGPRYTGETKEFTSSDKFLSSPYQKEGEKPFYNFDIDVNLSTGIPIQNISCPTHKVNIKYPQLSLANIELNKSEQKGGNRDFVLKYQLAGEKIESGLMLYEHNDENFFLLMVQPPKRVIKADIPPREYIFIVDVSGSMRGFPLSVTKSLMRNLVLNLRPTDKFNIMVFAGTSGWMAEESVQASLGNVEKAVQFIDNQRGGGGTNLLSAMQKALTFPRAEEGISRSFVVVTDGYISVEKSVFDLIKNNCDNANTFAFGIGTGVNRYLIEGIAQAGLGEPFFALNSSIAYAEAEKFREYISNPVLTQVKKSFSGFEAYDVEPITVPDVLAERPVIIYGKYKGEPKGTINIKGYTGKKRYKKTFDVSSVKPDKKNVALRYLWARKRIQMLDDYTKLAYNSNSAEEVTKLGLKYNLMTAYTSFLAIDDVIANDETIQTVNQPLPLPQGVSNNAIGNPQGVSNNAIGHPQGVSNYAIGFEMEVEEDGFSFFFYKEIIILSNMKEPVKEKLKLDIESELVTDLNLCFSNYVTIIDSVTVTIDSNGKVTHVEIASGTTNPKMEKEIIECFKKYDFTKYEMNEKWKFRITF